MRNEIRLAIVGVGNCTSALLQGLARYRAAGPDEMAGIMHPNLGGVIMSRTYRLAVIGCGSIAEIAHFPSIKRTAQAELTACCDTDGGRARSAAERWGAKAWYTDYREMFRTCELDAVIIASPNNVHRNQAVAAAKAGVHVIVEKPLAVTNTEAWDIVRACREHKIKLMVGCDRRFWTHNQWAR